MPEDCLSPKVGEIGRCFRFFVPDSSLVLATGSRRQSNFSTYHCSSDFGAHLGFSSSTNRRTCRPLNAPLIEPLSIRLQEASTNRDDDNSSSASSDNESVCEVKNPTNIPVTEKRKRILAVKRKLPKEYPSNEYENASIVQLFIRGELIANKSVGFKIF